MCRNNADHDMDITGQHIVMLELLFKQGKQINDFKVVGNQHGHSLTLHIIDNIASPKHSPGAYRNPSSQCRS